LGTLVASSETGNYESYATTIGALLQREWDTSVFINDPKPVFFYDADKTNMEVTQRGTESITVKEGSTLPNEDRTSDDHTLLGEEELLEIIIHAATITRRKLFEKEIKRILATNRPSRSGTFIKKSDESSNSSIHDYDESLIAFIPFGGETRKGNKISTDSSGILSVIYEYLFTA